MSRGAEFVPAGPVCIVSLLFDDSQVDENNMPISELMALKRPLESLVGSAFDLLQ